MNKNGKKMLEKISVFFQDIFLHKEKMLLLILSGILLFVICIPTKKSGNMNENRQNSLWNSGGDSTENITSHSTQDSTIDELEQYSSYLERKLKDQLLEMSGVGEVSVMITLNKTGRKIIAREEPIQKNSTVENDGGGGSRTIEDYKKDDTAIYIRGESGIESPFILQQEQPEIEGVLVVADGGGDGQIQFQITEAVQALFGIEPHKIKIVKRKS